MAKEAGNLKYIWSVGRFSGGEVHNVIADKCEMDISFRFYDLAFAERVKDITFKTCEEIARAYGGQVDINWDMSTGSVHNDENIVQNFRKYMAENEIDLTAIPPRMSSEDFGWYLTKAPGMIFRFGTRNESMGCTALAHRNDFKIDESGMKAALKVFCAYALHCI